MSSGSFFLPVVRFLFAVLLFLPCGCFEAGALHDPTATIESGNGTVDGRSGGENPLPGPFDPQDSHTGPAEANAEPSVFSTQIGETHDPQGDEDLCKIDITLGLSEIAAGHDDTCPPSKESLIAFIAPRVTLSSSDQPGEFSETADVTCTHTGWEVQLTLEAIFFHNLRTGEQRPRTFTLGVEILQGGAWQAVYSNTFTIACPWPVPAPGDECLTDDCESHPNPWES